MSVHIVPCDDSKQGEFSNTAPSVKLEIPLNHDQDDADLLKMNERMNGDICFPQLK